MNPLRRRTQLAALFRLLAAIPLVNGVGCADVWAGSISRDVANGLQGIQSYQGTTVEDGLGPNPVERSVLYARPWKVRIETTSPGPHQGELFVYDGDTLTLWYPKQLFGVRIEHARAPTQAQVLHHIERLTRVNLDAYTFSLRSEHAHVAGQPALEWLVRPATDAPYRMVHRVWNHDPSTLPLRMDFFRDPNTLWYRFQFKTLRFGVPIPPDAFKVTFPQNAVIFDWDLDAPGISLAEARAQMNFSVQLPQALPKGHAITKLIRSSFCLPLLLVSMDHDGSTLSLIESRYTGESLHPIGLPIRVGKAEATLSFLGAFTTVTWVRDGTLLTLTSTLDFPTLIGIAESVK